MVVGMCPSKNDNASSRICERRNCLYEGAALTKANIYMACKHFMHTGYTHRLQTRTHEHRGARRCCSSQALGSSITPACLWVLGEGWGGD